MLLSLDFNLPRVIVSLMSVHLSVRPIPALRKELYSWSLFFPPSMDISHSKPSCGHRAMQDCDKRGRNWWPHLHDNPEKNCHCSAYHQSLAIPVVPLNKYGLSGIHQFLNCVGTHQITSSKVQN